MSRTVFTIFFTVAILASSITLYQVIFKNPETTIEPSNNGPRVQTQAQETTTWPIEPEQISKQPTATAAVSSRPALNETPVQDNTVFTETQQRLQEQALRIAELKKIKAERLQQKNIINPYLLNQKSYDFENIQMQIEQNRSYQENLGQLASQEIELRGQQNMAIRNDLDLAISELSANIRDLQMQFDYNYGAPLEINTGIARSQYFNDLRGTLASQIEQLAALRNERANFSQTLRMQNQIFSFENQQQRNTLLEEQNFLQEQLLSLRSEIRDLQLANQQMNRSLVPLEQQIEQAEKDYQLLSEKLNEKQAR